MAALTTIPGATASITVAGGKTYKFFQVNLSTGPDLLDVSGFGDTYKSYVQGLMDLSGTFSGYPQTGTNAGNPLAGLTGATTITFSTGVSIAFTAISGKVNYSMDVEGKQVYTMEFANNNATVPTVVWPST